MTYDDNIDKQINNQYSDTVDNTQKDNEIDLELEPVGKIPEDADELEIEAEGADSIKKLKEKLKVCMAERQENLTGWQRTKADFVNARKAEEKSRAEFVTFAKEGIVEDLLPVVDSFELAFANKEAWGKVDANWRKGVEYIYAQLKSALEAHGLKELNPEGEHFDANHHMSIETVQTDNEASDGKIVEVIQKGYALGSKTVRVPKVKVAQLPRNEY